VLTLLKVFFLFVAKVFGILLKIPVGMVPCLCVGVCWCVCVCVCVCVKRWGNKLCSTKNNLRTATLQGRPVELFGIRK
jgi:hypothetical protein